MAIRLSYDGNAYEGKEAVGVWKPETVFGRWVWRGKLNGGELQTFGTKKQLREWFAKERETKK